MKNALTPMRLGINIDHVATLRQARGTVYPDPIDAANIAVAAGAHGITVHLREDRRHIQDHDVEHLAATLNVPLNLEMAVTDEMLSIAERIRPPRSCLVPEKRAELTTEGGLDVVGQIDKISAACARLNAIGTRTSLFIDPDPAQISAAATTDAPAIEIHTGTYADATTPTAQNAELKRIQQAAKQAAGLGLEVHAGHGLTVANVGPIAAIAEIVELNIGHAIVAQAVLIGLAAAVKEMAAAIQIART